MKYFLTIDAGTTSIKVVLIDECGGVASQFSNELNLLAPFSNAVEFEVENYWKITKNGIRKVLNMAKVRPQCISAIAISSQGETLINLDKEGHSLRNAIVWLDNRSILEAEKIKAIFGREEIFRKTGQPEVVATWPATKIIWLKNNQRHIFKKTAKFLMLEDYLLFCLTGKYVGEPSVHSSTLWLDINTRSLWMEMLKFLGVNPEQFADIVPSGKIAGTVSKSLARELNLSKETMVVTGALDQPAGAIGAGNIQPGICSETTGGAIAAVITTNKPIIDSAARIPCHCHGVNDKYFLMPWGPTAGMVLKWFKDAFCDKEQQYAMRKKEDVYSILERMADAISPGCNGLVMLPHLAGAASPEFNSYASGTYFGIRLMHTKSHFVRAIMESVAFMLRKNLDALSKLNIKIDEIRSLGGGAKSRVWNQIKADVTGYPVVTMRNSEAALLGVAMLAAVATGMHGNLKEASRKMVDIKDRYEPNDTHFKTYNENYRIYLELYENLKMFFWQR